MILILMQEDEVTMEQDLHHNGEYVLVNDHKMHVYRAGNINGPKWDE